MLGHLKSMLNVRCLLVNTKKSGICMLAIDNKNTRELLSLTPYSRVATIFASSSWKLEGEST